VGNDSNYFKSYLGGIMKIETKFNVGDKAVFIEYDYYPEKCNICDGKKKVTIKNEKFECPKCNGKGSISLNKKWQVNDDFGLSKILTIYSQRGETYAAFHRVAYTDIIEGTHYTHKFILLKDCFATKAEAQAECDRRNNG
jgi:predicted RNA-binding Zn-ribbon protein involved in translation (DUF1610 family)